MLLNLLFRNTVCQLSWSNLCEFYQRSNFPYRQLSKYLNESRVLRCIAFIAFDKSFTYSVTFFRLPLNINTAIHASYSMIYLFRLLSSQRGTSSNLKGHEGSWERGITKEAQILAAFVEVAVNTILVHPHFSPKMIAEGDILTRFNTGVNGIVIEAWPLFSLALNVAIYALFRVYI